MNTSVRYSGCLLGLAVGDALGVPAEGRVPGSFPPIRGMSGGGRLNLSPGQWTDDTSMALCLAESLVTCGRFDPADQMTRYLRWRREGHFASTGRCFGIGQTVAQALRTFEKTREPYCGSTDASAAGNGCIMRLAPVPMFFADDPAAAVRWSAESARTTHGARTCLDACRYFGGLIVGALRGEPKERLLADRYAPVAGLWRDEPLCPEIDAVAAGSFKTKEPPDIRGTGYVVESLEAALWAFYHAADFRDGCLRAVNLGDDADSTGAIYGQLAGAHYGRDGIPPEWVSVLAHREAIEGLASRLQRRPAA